jgi:hypothetical protein
MQALRPDLNGDMNSCVEEFIFNSKGPKWAVILLKKNMYILIKKTY